MAYHLPGFEMIGALYVLRVAGGIPGRVEITVVGDHVVRAGELVIAHGSSYFLPAGFEEACAERSSRLGMKR